MFKNILERPQPRAARASQDEAEILNSSIEVNLQEGKESNSVHVSTKEIDDSTRTMSVEKPTADFTNSSNEIDLVSQQQNTVLGFPATTLPEISSPHKNKANGIDISTSR